MLQTAVVKRGRAIRVMAAVAVMAVAAGACRSGSADDQPRTTVPTAPAETTTTAPADPYTVPGVIDKAYVDRVLAALNKVYGDVVRKIRSTGLYERSDLDSLGAIFRDTLLERQAYLFRDIPGRDPSVYREPIGDRRMTVEEIIIARPDCIYVRATLDVSDVAADPPPPATVFITLKPVLPGFNEQGINPTPWAMSRETDKREAECVDG